MKNLIITVSILARLIVALVIRTPIPAGMAATAAISTLSAGCVCGEWESEEIPVLGRLHIQLPCESDQDVKTRLEDRLAAWADGFFAERELKDEDDVERLKEEISALVDFIYSTDCYDEECLQRLLALYLSDELAASATASLVEVLEVLAAEAANEG